MCADLFFFFFFLNQALKDQAWSGMLRLSDGQKPYVWGVIIGGANLGMLGNAKTCVRAPLVGSLPDPTQNPPTQVLACCKLT